MRESTSKDGRDRRTQGRENERTGEHCVSAQSSSRPAVLPSRASPPPLFLGLVLAAGASSRMGRPKALLPTMDGRPLAVWQADRLRAAGCAEVLIVIGSHAADLRAGLAGEVLVEHPGWARGRAGSLQAGLRAGPDAAGWVVLPVDNVGIRTATLRALLAAVQPVDFAVRPCSGGAAGRAVWLGPAAAQMVAAAAADARVDELLRPRERCLAVDDPGVASNINTPAEWAAARTMTGVRDW